MDGKPSLEGQVGPLRDPGQGKIPVDVSVKLFKILDMGLKGPH
jgi:hypothetical protein